MQVLAGGISVKESKGEQRRGHEANYVHKGRWHRAWTGDIQANREAARGWACRARWLIQGVAFGAGRTIKLEHCMQGGYRGHAGHGWHLDTCVAHADVPAKESYSGRDSSWSVHGEKNSIGSGSYITSYDHIFYLARRHSTHFKVSYSDIQI
jgi:hypothetical protein